MRPFDPRLLRYARSARIPIALTALLGTITALLVLAQALLISAALSPIVSGTATLGDVTPFIMGIATVFACRAVIVAAREAVAARAATEAVTELRGRVINAAIALGPRWRAMKEPRPRRCCRPAWRICAPTSFLSCPSWSLSRR